VGTDNQSSGNAKICRSPSGQKGICELFACIHTKEIKSKQTFRHGAKTVEYNLIQSKRRKMCEAIVDEEQITIRAPLGKPLVESSRL
jgi:hypothetical protein